MSMCTQALTERLAELESRLEFQDETMTRLNDALAGQQQKYFELEKKLELLIARLRETSLGQPDPEREPPPPHY